MGRPLVITEKMDGSNVCLESRDCFARSHGHAPVHPSFSGFKAIHASVKSRIPGGYQIFGEWLYAKHSIHYTQLASYLQVFGVHSIRSWHSWPSVEAFAGSIGVPTVPVLRRLTATTEAELRAVIQETALGLGGDSEGFVVRWEDDFSDALFKQAVGKWVRAGHVTSEEHWRSQAIVRNGLRKT